MKFSDFSVLGLGALALNAVTVSANTADTALLRTYSTISPSLSEIESAASATEVAEVVSDVEGAANFF